ncbi:hypothetical protein H7X87_01595 [Acetobacteraceae bacterium]|nr:hypothetical protein [Candidatus Parcubacteria bacterium]
MIQYLVFVGAAINIWGAVIYIRDTLRGQTKPNRITWLMWGIAPLIGTTAAFVDGARWILLPALTTGLCPLIVFVVSFINPNAYWKLTKFDYICGALALAALGGWIITSEPLVAVVLAILADLFAGIPTFIKAWKYPETETGFAYVTAFFAMLTSFAALQTWSFAEYGFPGYLVLANACLIVAVYRKRLIR